MKTSVNAKLDFMLELWNLSQDDVKRAGTKAANEAALLQAGFVLTTDAFATFLAANSITPESAPDGLPEKVAAAPVPTEVLDALYAGVAILGDGPLVVLA
jgi:phosphoenolpyruvate synthase/pyruvate phosphate dikinase